VFADLGIQKVGYSIDGEDFCRASPRRAAGPAQVANEALAGGD